jgi:hypothetical protein
MAARTVSQISLPTTIMYGFLAVLILVALVLFTFTAWIVTLDRRGTFHNTTDVADLDGDGDMDVLLHNVRTESETVSFSQTTLWINQGQGKFTPRQIEFPPYLYLSAAAGDLDGDQDADLAVLAVQELMFYLNQGGAQGGEIGEFKRSPSIYPPKDPGTPGSLVLGDLNGDGTLDGFIAGCCGMSFSPTSGEEVYLPSVSWVWINKWNPDGWFEHQKLNLEQLHDLPIRETALGDLDGNGSLDVFAAVKAPKPGRASLPADLVLLNNGSGGFIDSGQRLGDMDSSSVALGDLDADGDLDAMVGTRNGVVVWINQGGSQGGQVGVFVNSITEIDDDHIKAVFLEDLDHDGDQDALIIGIRHGAIWWNDGLGGFSHSKQHFSYSNRHGFAVEDFDGDGWSDIFAADYSNGYMFWFNQRDGTFRSTAQQ